ncbi:MAG: acylphosphatase [Proteobacteria bacterium]|nr:acylphosphatase [Pseudomonadota bacterium]
MTPPRIERVKLQVKGRVQGVYYRASTLEQARSLRLAGWVRNTASGDVEIEAEGPSDAVAELIAWCRQGPPHARVRDVAVEFIPARGDLGEFEIRY